ncbi:MAG TPA: hypothetical protein VMM15_31225 [Bradyrhizobium sp.]|nr:hypothetical protein [Bradyrhizobium sp.]
MAALRLGQKLVEEHPSLAAALSAPPLGDLKAWGPVYLRERAAVLSDARLARQSGAAIADAVAHRIAPLALLQFMKTNAVPQMRAGICAAGCNQQLCSGLGRDTVHVFVVGEVAALAMHRGNCLQSFYAHTESEFRAWLERVKAAAERQP